ncbi:MAG TPA: hypothetical protein P5556_01975 [Candidatus Gastranaerophilales bacterium]|nr:hypothetical protein [Candidatus Gastranaerophilales bacterium]
MLSPIKNFSIPQRLNQVSFSAISNEDYDAAYDNKDLRARVLNKPELIESNKDAFKYRDLCDLNIRSISSPLDKTIAYRRHCNKLLARGYQLYNEGKTDVAYNCMQESATMALSGLNDLQDCLGKKKPLD